MVYVDVPGELKVGSKVWWHSERHYRPADWKHEDDFHEVVITGETRISWVVKEGWREFKFPKRKPADEYHKDPETRLASGGRGRTTRIYLTGAAVRRDIWLWKNRDALRKQLDSTLSSGDFYAVKKVADAVGYKEQA